MGIKIYLFFQTSQIHLQVNFEETEILRLYIKETFWLNTYILEKNSPVLTWDRIILFLTSLSDTPQMTLTNTKDIWNTEEVSEGSEFDDTWDPREQPQ